MSVVEEIREQQKQALSAMSFREKLAYFWDYYKIHTFVAVALVVVVVSIAHQIATNKDYAFYATLLNAETTEYEDETADAWAEGFQQYAQIDPDEYQVYIDTSLSLSDSTDPQYLVANQQKLVALLQAGSIHAQIAETKTFESYAQLQCYYHLEEILSPEEIEKYRSDFYYTDASTFEQDEDDLSAPQDASALVIDHRDPSSMEQPIAVGIILTGNPTMADSEYYSYLADPKYDYQGYPADVVFGIPISNKEPELAVLFLEYLGAGGKQ